MSAPRHPAQSIAPPAGSLWVVTVAVRPSAQRPGRGRLPPPDPGSLQWLPGTTLLVLSLDPPHVELLGEGRTGWLPMWAFPVTLRRV